MPRNLKLHRHICYFRLGPRKEATQGLCTCTCSSETTLYPPHAWLGSRDLARAKRRPRSQSVSRVKPEQGSQNLTLVRMRSPRSDCRAVDFPSPQRAIQARLRSPHPRLLLLAVFTMSALALATLLGVALDGVVPARRLREQKASDSWAAEGGRSMRRCKTKPQDALER